MQHICGSREIYTGVSQGWPKERDNLKYLDLDGRIMLEWILNGIGGYGPA